MKARDRVRRSDDVRLLGTLPTCLVRNQPADLVAELEEQGAHIVACATCEDASLLTGREVTRWQCPRCLAEKRQIPS